MSLSMLCTVRETIYYQKKIMNNNLNVQINNPVNHEWWINTETSIIELILKLVLIEAKAFDGQLYPQPLYECTVDVV